MNNIKQNLKILFTFLFVYIILFEFALPPNDILPKPSLLLEALAALFTEYKILDKLFITVSAVYGGLILGGILLFITRNLLFKISLNFDKNLNKLNIFSFIPAFFYAVLFSFWFESSVLAEIGFAVIAVYFFFVKTYLKEISEVKPEYIESAKSLGFSDNKISGEVIWKSVLPGIFKKINSIHYYIWTGLIIYEFVGNNNGIGYIYNSIIEYKDLSALIGLAILLSILVLIGTLALNSINKKMINWES